MPKLSDQAVGFEIIAILISLIVYCGVVFGISWGVGAAELSYPIRLWISGNGRKVSPFRALIVSGLECLGCTSFHFGWLAFLSGNTPAGIFEHWWQAAMFSATSSLVLAKAAGITDYPAPKGGAGHDGRDEEPPAGG
jgi:hypothetical protein